MFFIFIVLFTNLNIMPAAQVNRMNVYTGMVWLPGGSFFMGSPENESGRYNNETPHAVSVNSFYIGISEITQKEWQEVMGSSPSNFKGENLPVEMVSWYDAVEYCNARSIKEGLKPAYTINKSAKDPNNKSGQDNIKWIVSWDKNANGYRLPTEAEWEYACRAGTSTAFYTGDSISTDKANYDGNYPYNKGGGGVYRESTTAVATFQANPWGLYDMHGNVWEWCWDWYGILGSEDRSDPAGPGSGVGRVLRGGSFQELARDIRSASRTDAWPTRKGAYLGFRVARSM